MNTEQKEYDNLPKEMQAMCASFMENYEFATQQEEAEYQAQEKKQQLQQKKERLLNGFCAPRRYIEAHKSISKDCEAWSRVFLKLREVIQPNSGHIVLFSGRSGTGKTQMAIELAYAFIGTHLLNATYIEAFNLRNKISEDWNNHNNNNRKKLHQVPLLIIDELDCILQKQEAQATENAFMLELYAILSSRHSEMLNTILISNKGIGELSQSMLAPITNRIIGDGTSIDFNNQNFIDWRRHNLTVQNNAF